MAKKASLKGKKGYATYNALNSFGKNKARKIATHIKKQPNDALAVEALKTAKGSSPTRKKPTTTNGWIKKGDLRYVGLTKKSAKLLAKITAFEKTIANQLQYDRSSVKNKTPKEQPVKTKSTPPKKTGSAKK